MERNIRRVDVWQAGIALPKAALAMLRGALDEAELDRAERIQSSAGRLRFVIGRGLLRLLLAEKLGIHPTSVAFQHNAYGKPSIAPKPASVRPALNVTHSGELVMVAVGDCSALGIDLERRRGVRRADRIVRTYFTPEERRTYASVPAEARLEAFFRMWTSKEAVVKAMGVGIAGAFRRVSAPGLGPETRVGAWRVHRWDPAPGYAAALAVPLSEEVVIHRREWRPEGKTGPTGDV